MDEIDKLLKDCNSENGMTPDKKPVEPAQRKGIGEHVRQKLRTNPSAKWAMIICLGLIIGSLLYLVVARGKAFEKVLVITYIDGCNETYVNDKLNSSECASKTTMKEDAIFGLDIPDMLGKNISASDINISYINTT